MIRRLAPLAVLIAILLASSPLRADCTGPAGVAGEIIYNADHHVVQFCNGTNWLSTASSGATSLPGGSNGYVQFNNNDAFGGNTKLFWDNSLERLGIGTSAPAQTLDVTGTAAISGAMTMGSTLAVTGAVTGASFNGSGAALTSLNADNLSSGTVGTARLGSGTADSSTYLRGDGTWAAPAGTFTGSGNNNYVAKFTGTTALGNSLFFDNGSAVGIGVTPRAVGTGLDANGTIAVTNSSNIGGTDFTAAGWTTTGGGVIGWNMSSGYGEMSLVSISGGGSDGGFSFYDRNTALMRITKAGNVGIGTTGPNVKLDVAGPIVSRVYNAGSSTTIDWSNSNVAYTTASCGGFTFSNMQDGGTYTLFVEGTTSGTCSFTHSGLTVKLPPGHGATTAGTMTVYAFTRAGSYIFTTWQKGY